MGNTPDIQVSLYLIGDPLELAELKTVFQVEPIVSIAKGEPRIRKATGQVVGVHAASTWGFSSAQAVGSSEIEDHSAWLVSKAAPAIPLLNCNPNIEAFFEVTMSGLSSCSCVLPKNLLALARELNAEVGVVARNLDAA